MRKKTALAITMMLLAALLAACGSAGKLADGFDEAEVIAAAENAVTVLNTGDYEAFRALGDEGLQEALTPEVIQNAVDQIMPDAGVFVAFGSATAVGQKDAAGADYAVAILVADYENQQVTFTISLNRELLLTGFYLK